MGEKFTRGRGVGVDHERDCKATARTFALREPAAAELTPRAACDCEPGWGGQRRTARTVPHCQSAIWSTRQLVSSRTETTSTTRLQPSE